MALRHGPEIAPPPPGVKHGDRSFFGHPRGLATLFFTEMWERFSYYGMRAILTLFMTAAIAEGGLGFKPEESGPIYAMYTSLVYLVTIPGGWIADNFLGQRKSVLWGGFVIMLGHICLAMHGLMFFYMGLGLIITGTGLLKPNISVMVGQLYSEKDIRRDSGFSIFYMGINLGALISPLVCGWLAQNPFFKEKLIGWGLDPINSWHWGFGAAAVGMALGLLQYLWTGRHLGQAGLHPVPPKNAEAAARNKRTLTIGLVGAGIVAAGLTILALARPESMTKSNINTGFTIALFVIVIGFFTKLFLTGDWTKAERARLTVITILFCAAAVFWGVFEQAGSTLTLFADRSTDNTLFGWSFDSSWWQSVNALMIVILAPVFSWLWIALGKRNPSYPTKFGVGLLFVGLGFLWLVGGANAAEGGKLVGVHWLAGVYLLHTIGELCLSPVGLSSMTKLAPQRVVSMMMGVWFLAASVGNFMGGSVSSYYEKFELPTLFGMVGLSAIVMSVVMFILVRPVKRMMEAGGVASSTDHSA
jgi:POT family proton-dependent oligopeptide transporter